MTQQHTIIIGAGAAGLATAVCLQKKGLDSLILEQAAQVGVTWRNHYDRLHLHTDKRGSQLPHLPMPKASPRYISRDQFVTYLEQYVAHFQLNIQFNEAVVAVEQRGDSWLVKTESGEYEAKNVVVATGYTRRPFTPSWPNQENYQGQISHSASYQNGQPYAGKNVLVVGFGNSAAEIAMDLCENGAAVAMSVRGRVNVIPRDLLGIPILTIGIWMSIFPPRLADALSAPIVRLAVGDITRYGLQKAAVGPITQIVEEGNVPLLDIGTMKLIKQGRIQIHTAIERFTTDGVVFTNGNEAQYDAIICGTGYRPKANEFLGTMGVLDEEGTPLTTGQPSSANGLYFCGFYISPTGMIREAGIEAKRISEAIA